MIDSKMVASRKYAAQAVANIKAEQNIPIGQGRWLWTADELEESKADRIAAVQHTVRSGRVHEPLATKHNVELA